MGWFILAHIFSTILSLIQVGLLSDKDQLTPWSILTLLLQGLSFQIKSISHQAFKGGLPEIASRYQLTYHQLNRFTRIQQSIEGYA